MKEAKREEEGEEEKRRGERERRITGQTGCTCVCLAMAPPPTTPTLVFPYDTSNNHLLFHFAVLNVVSNAFLWVYQKTSPHTFPHISISLMPKEHNRSD